MDENMVRTQVYLTRAHYEELQRRAEKENITMAEQIREALDQYLRLTAPATEQEPLALGDLFEILATLEGGGPTDLAENHDAYLYGDALEPTLAPQTAARSTNKAAKAPTPKPVFAIAEEPQPYTTKKRKNRKAKP